MIEERDVLSADLEIVRRALGTRVLRREYTAANEALDRLRACLDETRLEIEALERMGRSYNDLWRQEKAEVARLREALQEIADTADVNSDNWFVRMNEICAFADAALSAPVSTPNSQKEAGA